MLVFDCRTKILVRFLLRLFTYRLNLSSLGDVVASLGWKEIWGTWPPVDRPPWTWTWHYSFQLGSFLCGCKHHNSKREEDRFDRRVRENFHKVNEKMGYEEFRLFSLIFGYFRLFSKSVYQVKKISQFRLLIVLSLFWKDSFWETIYSVVSSFYS